MRYPQYPNSPIALEDEILDRWRKEKLFEQVTSGLYVTDAELWRSWQDANDSASVSFVAFRPTPTGADTTIADGDLRKFYEAHKTEFDRPGRAVVSVVYIPRIVTAADGRGMLAHASSSAGAAAAEPRHQSCVSRHRRHSGVSGSGAPPARARSGRPGRMTNSKRLCASCASSRSGLRS